VGGDIFFQQQEWVLAVKGGKDPQSKANIVPRDMQVERVGFRCIYDDNRALLG
jgi:hypothetical protein